MFDLDQDALVFEPIVTTGPALIKLAVMVETMSEAWSDHRLQQANIDILRVHTGEPYYTVKGQHAVTWDEYGPGALGNPVYAMPDYTGNLTNAISLIPDRTRLQLNLAEDREKWTGLVTFEDARHSTISLTMSEHELARLVTILGLRARAKLV